MDLLFRWVARSTILLVLGIVAAYANPDGAQVVHGQVGFSHSGPQALIITNSPGAIINWQQFSIQDNETVRFIQRAASSAILNRVVGHNPSAVLGRLLSNGRVFLINSNGIIFGRNAVIDTAGFVASTLNITDQDFISENLKFQGDSTAGAINNQGYIKAGANGDIYLIAPNIENSGIIESDGGQLILAAGQSVTLASLDSDSIVFEVQAPENEVLNLGQLLTHGGAVRMFAGTLHQAGRINADTIAVGSKGEIILSASSNISLLAGSSISASGAPGTVHGGGEVRIIAEHTLDMKHGTEVHVDGGSDGGDGGFLELSGKQKIALNGEFSGQAKAPGFRHGSILIDPVDINIVSAGGDNTGGDGIILSGDPGATLNIDPTSLMGGWVNVSLAASNDITVSSPITDGNIPATGTLTLDAGNNVNINADIGSSADYFEHDLFVTAGNTISINAEVYLQNNDSTPNDLSSLIAAQAVNFSAAGQIDINDAAPIESFGVLRIHATNSGAAINLDAASSITHTGNFSPGALIELRADDVILNGTVTAPSVGVSLQTYNTGREIDLGTNTAGKLGLSDSELDNINADDIRIGRFDSGNVTVSAPVGPDNTSDMLILVRSMINVSSATGITTSGMLLLEGADMDIQADLTSTASRVILQTPSGTVTPMEIGTSGPGVGVVALDQAELDHISVGWRLEIGKYSTPDITFTAPISYSSELQVRSQNSILVNAALSAPTLTLRTDNESVVINGSVDAPSLSVTVGSGPGDILSIASGAWLKGAGTINGDVNNSGTLKPGASPGILTISGDLTLNPSSVIEVELGGLTQASQYDVLDVAGNAVLSGTLDSQWTGGFTGNINDSFKVIECGGGISCMSGIFSTVNPPLAAGLNTTYNDIGITIPNFVQLMITAAPPAPPVSVTPPSVSNTANPDVEIDLGIDQVLVLNELLELHAVQAVDLESDEPGEKRNKGLICR